MIQSIQDLLVVMHERIYLLMNHSQGLNFLHHQVGGEDPNIISPKNNWLC